MKVMFKIISLLFLGAGFMVSTDPLAQAESAREWPLEIQSRMGLIAVYELEPESLQGNKLTGRSAISLTRPGANTPIFGMLWFSAKISINKDTNSYEIQSIKITKLKFPNSNAEQEREISELLERELSKRRISGSWEELREALEIAKEEKSLSQNFATQPPKIIFVTYPAVLVLLDGPPKLQAIEGSRLMRVVNTPMLMVFDPETRRYYLSSGNIWYSASEVLGSWRVDYSPPPEVAEMVTEDGEPLTNPLPEDQLPRIIVSEVPAELIVTQGEPQYSPIPGTDLLYLTNSENDVLLDISTQYYYVLLSGRWYRAKSLHGPWSYVPGESLPKDFSKIPSQSVKGNVRTSVPGTEEAEEAVRDSQIPEVRAIERDEAKLEVIYDGPPKFEHIRGTNMDYAVNANLPVIFIHKRYYACSEGVWFVAPTPYGPWEVADSIPAEIKTIPPECPIYYVKYVYIYDYTPEVVYVGYTPGYLGYYPLDGVIVFGTGYWYPSWYKVYYFPRPCTWGFFPHYVPVVGWTIGYTWSVPFLTIGFSWNYGWHSWDWYGPAGYYGWQIWDCDHYHQTNIYYNTIVYKNVNIYRNVRIGNQIKVGNYYRKLKFEPTGKIYQPIEHTRRIVSKTEPKIYKTVHATTDTLPVGKKLNVHPTKEERLPKRGMIDQGKIYPVSLKSSKGKGDSQQVLNLHPKTKTQPKIKPTVQSKINLYSKTQGTVINYRKPTQPKPHIATSGSGSNPKSHQTTQKPGKIQPGVKIQPIEQLIHKPGSGSHQIIQKSGRTQPPVKIQQIDQRVYKTGPALYQLVQKSGGAQPGKIARQKNQGRQKSY